MCLKGGYILDAPALGGCRIGTALTTGGKAMAAIQTPLGLFDFQAFNMDGQWNGTAGVYMFVRPSHNGNLDVLYVGLCESFANRMPNHDRWDEAVRLGANSVHAVVVPDKATREALEKHLIQQFQPQLNTQHLGGLFRR